MTTTATNPCALAALPESTQAVLFEMHRVQGDMTTAQRAYAGAWVASAGRSAAAFGLHIGAPELGPTCDLFRLLMSLLFDTEVDTEVEVEVEEGAL